MGIKGAHSPDLHLLSAVLTRIEPLTQIGIPSLYSKNRSEYWMLTRTGITMNFGEFEGI